MGMAKESIKKESIKKQLMFTKDEIKKNLSNNTFMKTTVVLVKDGRIQKTVPNAVVVDGRVYYKQRIGVGEPRIVGGLFDGEGDCFEEYDEYETVLLPIIDGLNLDEEEKEMLKKLDVHERAAYGEKYPDKVARLGVRQDGSKVMWMIDHETERQYAAQEEEINNLHIVEVPVYGNLGVTTYFTLSRRLPYYVWEQLKEYFYYADARDYHDEVWEGHFCGWAIKKDKVGELEKLLEIPEHLTIKAQRQKKREELKRLEQSKAELKNLEKRLGELFEQTDSIQIPKDQLEEWHKSHVRLVGEWVENPYNPPDVYGGGEWFVIQGDCIWHVINNGHDGDCWDLNFIKTGGAGAYGYKFEKTKERVEVLNKVKELSGVIVGLLGKEERVGISNTLRLLCDEYR